VLHVISSNYYDYELAIKKGGLGCLESNYQNALILYGHC
jgi:hypothetical protein